MLACGAGNHLTVGRAEINASGEVYYIYADQVGSTVSMTEASGQNPCLNSFDGSCDNLNATGLGGSDPCVYLNAGGTAVESVDSNSSQMECQMNGGTWVQPGDGYAVDGTDGFVVDFPQAGGGVGSTCRWLGLASIVDGIGGAIPSPLSPALAGLSVVTGLWAVSQGCI